MKLDEVDRLVKKKEAADLHACSTRTIDRLAASGLLTPVRILGGTRFRLSQINALMNGVPS